VLLFNLLMDLISPELARIHAHLCGDGSVCKFPTNEKGRKNTAVVGYYNNNQKLLDEFRKDFSKLFGVKMKMQKNKSVSIRSIKRHDYFVNRFGVFGSRGWRIHGSIKKSVDKIKLEWIKAFLHDEAYHEKRYDRMKIKSMNHNGLKDVLELLKSLKIFSNITGPNCDNSYYLTIPQFSNVSLLKRFTKDPARKKTRCVRPRDICPRAQPKISSELEC